MLKYSLAHVGINAANKEEAEKGCAHVRKPCSASRSRRATARSSRVIIELMKEPYMGKNGHIAIGTPDVPAAKAELEARGFTFNDAHRAKFKADGTLNAIYLTDEICGFAVHLVGKK